MKKYIGHIDWFIMIPAAGMMFFSMAFVYSASATFAETKLGAAEKLFMNHGIRVAIAFFVMLLFAKIDYHIWKKISKPFIMLSISLLAIVLAIGSAAHGAARWIDLGPFSFQPSELAKFALVLHFARLLADKQEFIKDFKRGFLPFMVWLLAVCGLIALQPNLSTTALIFFIGFSMLFIGNTNLLHLLSTLTVMVSALGLFAVSATYRLNRILAFLGMGDGSSQVETVNYQLNQALIAIGNGGLTGVGPGQNRQSHWFLPESYGDFIFSIIGEEYGFFGIIAIIFAFGLIFWRGMLIAKKAPDDFGYFLAVGIIVTCAFYVFVNAGVNTGLLPTTGVPMPFISYGGTAVIIYAGAIGVLLNISAQAGVIPKTNLSAYDHLNIKTESN